MRSGTGAGEQCEIKQIIIFDGKCGMCSRFVKWSLDHLKRPDTGFIASQSEAGQTLLQHLGKDSSPSTLYLLWPDGVLDRSDAVLELLKSFRSPYSRLALFRWIPRGGRDWVYRGIAKVRKSVPLKRVACGVDHPYQNLLIDPIHSNWPKWLKHIHS